MPPSHPGAALAGYEVLLRAPGRHGYKQGGSSALMPVRSMYTKLRCGDRHPKRLLAPTSDPAPADKGPRPVCTKYEVRVVSNRMIIGCSFCIIASPSTKPSAAWLPSTVLYNHRPSALPAASSNATFSRPTAPVAHVCRLPVTFACARITPYHCQLHWSSPPGCARGGCCCPDGTSCGKTPTLSTHS